MNYHQGPRFQRGRGLGAIFSALARGIAPIARLGLRAGKSFLSSPLVKKIGQTALDAAKQSAVNLSADLLEGRDMQESAQNELNNARSKIASTLRGGKKRKKHLSKKTSGAKKSKPSKKIKNIKYSLLD
jgi:hypothetical protein